MLVVNLIAGPGAGKSTYAAALFARLKMLGVECELVNEYAKDKVWEGSLNVLDNQLYVTAKQHHKLFRLNGKVDVAITDSPLIMGLYYGKGQSVNYQNLIKELWYKFENLTFFIERAHEYNPNGRNHTQAEAEEIDYELFNILKDEQIYAHMISSEHSKEALDKMEMYVLHELKLIKNRDGRED